MVINAEIKSMMGADLAFVLNWRNHSSIRAQSNTENIISEGDHLKWFQDGKKIKTLFMLNSDPTGVIRFDPLEEEFDPEGEVYQWSFFLDPFKTHPKGTGTLMLTLAIQFLRQIKTASIIGQVKSENQASAKLHLKLGFKEIPNFDSQVRRFYKKL